MFRNGVKLTLYNPGVSAGRCTVRASLEDRDVVVDREPSRALSRALDSKHSLTVVCGSIYLIGEVRRELHRRFGVPEPTVDTRTGP